MIIECSHFLTTWELSYFQKDTLGLGQFNYSFLAKPQTTRRRKRGFVHTFETSGLILFVGTLSVFSLCTNCGSPDLMLRHSHHLLIYFIYRNHFENKILVWIQNFLLFFYGPLLNFLAFLLALWVRKNGNIECVGKTTLQELKVTH